MVYTNTAEVSAKNHVAISATASLEIRDIKVLAATGFNPRELATILFIIASSFGLAIMIRKRVEEKN
jgi:hypothetical protein